MLAFFIAAMIANAFIVLKYSPLSFYKLHRYDGQLLYIKAVFIGMFVTAVAYRLSAYLGLASHLSNVISLENSQFFPEIKHLDLFFLFFIVSAAISVFYCILENVFLFVQVLFKFKCGASISFYRRMAKILLMRKILQDSPLDNLLFQSYSQNKFLLISMSDRKVYVGRVISLGEPNENEGPDQEIAIVPVFSGYRCKDTLDVTLTRTYKTNEESADEEKNVYLILKQENIVSACEFVASLYEKSSRKSLSN